MVEFDDDDVLLGPDPKKMSAKQNNKDQTDKDGESSSEGEGAGRLTPDNQVATVGKQIEKAFFEKSPESSSKMLQWQFKKSVRSKELQAYLKKLASGQGPEFDHFLQLLARNQVSSNMLETVVATIANGPNAEKTLNAVYNATSLKENVAKKVQQIKPQFSAGLGKKKKEEEYQSPFKKPTDIPKLIIE